MKLSLVVAGDQQTQPTTNSEEWQDYLIDSCEEEAQLKIRGATTAAAAWIYSKTHMKDKSGRTIHEPRSVKV